MLWQPNSCKRSIMVGQLLGGDRPPLPLPTDVEVLAEHAAEVALAEEDRAGAVPAPQAILLAMMGKGTADDRQPPSAAVGSRAVVLAPVGMALARADGAVGQGVDRLAGAAGKLTAFQQFQVAGPGGGHRTVPGDIHSLPNGIQYYCRFPMRWARPTPARLDRRDPERDFGDRTRPDTMSGQPWPAPFRQPSTPAC